MKTLKEVIADAEAKKVAVGHFNISDTEGLWAIFNAARELSVPVIIGVSEGERKFIGVRQAAALVKSVREEFDYPIYINADHSYSLDSVKEAVDAGFDSVIFDGSKTEDHTQVRAITKQCVDYAKSKNPDILVEGEMGFIGMSSKLLDEVPEGVGLTREFLTKSEDAKAFVEETGVDLLAPAVGNLHGMLKHAGNPHIDVGLVKEIREASGVPLVLHGGSGIPREDYTEAVQVGMSIVHVNTEIRVAYRKGIERAFAEDAEEVAPYRFLKQGVEGMQAVVLEKLKLFNRL